MADIHPNGSSPKPAPVTGPAARRRSPWPLALLAILFVVVPFLTWYGTWFGRKLSEEDTAKYLSDEEHPRHVQHALSQIAERMDDRDESVKQWYPQIVKLAESPLAEFRLTVAWLMGKDSRAEEFHQALLRLLDDSEPIVRRNAALSLAVFKDARGRTELHAMLQPYTVVSTGGGVIASVLNEGSNIAVGSLLVRLKRGEQVQEIRSPLPGKIVKVLTTEGASVKTGDPLFTLGPDIESAWEALRAFYLIGQTEDLPDIERYSQGVEGMPEKVKKQATLTVEAIQSRSSDSSPSTSPNQQKQAEHPAG